MGTFIIEFRSFINREIINYKIKNNFNFFKINLGGKCQLFDWILLLCYTSVYPHFCKLHVWYSIKHIIDSGYNNVLN